MFLYALAAASSWPPHLGRIWRWDRVGAVQAGGSLLPTAASSKHGFMEKGELGGEEVWGSGEGMGR
jgi:hypothetical protein